jgi:hypothetical protein
VTDRRYSDDEVALILRKAADLQVQGAVPAQGLDLAAIQDIAKEVGIRPETVAEAADIIARSPLTPSAGSSNSKFHMELFAPAKLSESELAELPSVIRQVLQHQGRVHEVLGTVEWTSVGEPSQIAVVIRPTENGTKIEMSANREGSAVLSFVPTTLGGTLLGAIIGATTEPNVGVGIALMAATATAGASLGWAIWQRNTAHFKRKMLRLADALRETLKRD